MKKVIGGKLYNTETAKFIGSWSNGLGSRDFSFCEEALYRTKSAAYFLFGEGGPMSKYAVSVGNNSWSGGSEIIPMSFDAAREWAEEKLDADEYIEAFGEPEEAGDERSQMLLSLSAATKAKLQRASEKSEKSMSQIVEELVGKLL